MKFLLITLLFLPSLAFACSWDGDPTGGVPYEERVINYIKNADYIFLGKVDDYEWKPNPKRDHGNPWHYHKISIIEQFKGHLEGPIEYWPATSCHEVFSYVSDDTFIFFGFDEYESIQFPMISGSITISDANEIGLIDTLRRLIKKPSNK
jgi:hypothetical protein